MLTQAKAGDSDAFASFYDTHFPGLLRWFLVRTAATDVSADLCAETFASALASLDRFDPDLGSSGAWLYGIAKNELRSWQRKRRVANTARTRLGILIDAPNEDELDLVVLRLDLEAMIGPLNRAMASLSDETRRVLELRVIDGRPYAEIAEIVGCKETAARVRVSRALLRLLERLEPGDVR